MQHNYVDITGKRFGRLIAIKPTERKICNSSYWICKCDCGNYTEVLKSALMRKKILLYPADVQNMILGINI